MNITPNHRLVSLALLGLLLASFCLTGCSSLGPRAVELATAGGKSSRGAEAALTSLGEATQGAVEKRSLLVAFGKQPPPSAEVVEAMSSSAAAVFVRARMLEKLGATYDTFGKLAAYNSADSINPAFKDLDDGIHAYAKAINTTLPGGFSELTQLGGALTGILINARRDSLLMAYSAKLRERLAAIETLFKQESIYYTSIRRDAAEKEQMLLEAALENGLLDITDLVASQLSASGATIDKKKLAEFIAPKGSIKAEWVTAAVTILRRRADTEFEATQKAIEDSGKLITKLIKAHDDFEARQPLSLAEIGAEAANIQAIADLLQKYKNASK